MDICKKILLALIIFVFTGFPVLASENSQNDFDEFITIDGRTYKVSPDFEIPAGIDKDSPVKLNFSDETHELLSIERLIDDDSNNNQNTIAVLDLLKQCKADCKIYVNLSV